MLSFEMKFDSPETNYSSYLVFQTVPVMKNDQESQLRETKVCVVGFLSNVIPTYFLNIHNFTILCHWRFQIFTLELGKSSFWIFFKLALTLSPEVSLIAVGDNLHFHWVILILSWTVLLMYVSSCIKMDISCL